MKYTENMKKGCTKKIQKLIKNIEKRDTKKEKAVARLGISFDK